MRTIKSMWTAVRFCLWAVWYLASAGISVLFLWPQSRRHISRDGLVLLPEDAQ